MPGDSGLCPFAEYCGWRKSGWLGSFQIAHQVTSSLKRLPTAVTNFWKSAGRGRVTLSLRLAVAHLGTGPEMVSTTFMPRSCAAWSRRSYLAKPGYWLGSVASNDGRVAEFGSGATSFQYMTTRRLFAPSA